MHEEKEKEKEGTRATPSELPTPKEKKPDFQEHKLADTSLEGLQAEEKELGDLVKAIPDGTLKTKLVEFLQYESEFVRTSGINGLDKRGGLQQTANGPTSTPLRDGSQNLAQFQERRKIELEALLASEAADESLKKEITKRYADLHQTRLNLLEKTLRGEQNKYMSNAFQRLQALLNMGPGQVNAYVDGQNPKSSFIDIISNKNPPQIEGNGKFVHFDGDTFTSNNPEALGLAIVAAGHKSATFSGAPKEALAAARSAVMNGLETVNFDKTTMKAIYNPSAYKSRREYQTTVEELQGILKIADANKSIRNYKTNPVFNSGSPSGLSENALRFNQIPTSTPGHREFIQGLTAQEQEDLAYELRNHQYHNGQESESGDRYVKRLVGAAQQGQLQKALNEKEATEIADNLVEKFEAADETPEAIAKKIDEQSPRVRGQLLSKLPELGNKQNLVRAHLLSQLMDRSLAKASTKEPIGLRWMVGGRPNKANSEFATKLGELFSGVSSEDRKEVHRIFNDYPQGDGSSKPLNRTMTTCTGTPVLGEEKNKYQKLLSQVDKLAYPPGSVSDDDSLSMRSSLN
jgi:hypothetical protein